MRVCELTRCQPHPKPRSLCQREAIQRRPTIRTTRHSGRDLLYSVVARCVGCSSSFMSWVTEVKVCGRKRQGPEWPMLSTVSTDLPVPELEHTNRSQHVHHDPGQHAEQHIRVRFLPLANDTFRWVGNAVTRDNVSVGGASLTQNTRGPWIAELIAA